MLFMWFKGYKAKQNGGVQIRFLFFFIGGEDWIFGIHGSIRLIKYKYVHD